MSLVKAEELGMALDGLMIFNSVSFLIRPGEHHALLGPSGSGKSTLLRLISGLEVPTEGRLWIDGQVASKPNKLFIAPHLRKLAMVFQDLALWPTLTVFDNMMLGLSGSLISRHERHSRVIESLRICKIENLRTRKPAALSIGQQQRVALARALAVRPKLLLLDEPFASLDLLLKRELFGELSQLVERFGITLILVTHDPSEARALCSRVLVLEDGQVCEKGTWAELMMDPTSKTLRAFARLSTGTYSTPEDSELDVTA